MLALIILLATRDCRYLFSLHFKEAFLFAIKRKTANPVPVSYFLSRGGPVILVGSGVLLLYISAGLSLWSFVVYTREICKVLRR